MPGLLDALSDEDAGVRWMVVDTLRIIGDAAAVPRLIELLSDIEQPEWSSDRICDAAAEALKSIGTPEALAAVAAWRKGQGGQS